MFEQDAGFEEGGGGDHSAARHQDSQDDSFLHRRPRSQDPSQRSSQDPEEEDGNGGEGDDAGDHMTFVCEMENAKELQSLLSCLANFKNTKPGHQHAAQVMVTDKDLVFVLVSKNKTTQVTGTIPQKIFKSYRIERGGVRVAGRHQRGGGGGGGGGGGAEDGDGGARGRSHVEFCINLATLMDCLTIFGPTAATSTAVTMRYDQLDASFVVELEHDGVLTSCTVRTLDPGSEQNASDSWSQMTNAFRATDEVCKAMLKSECLKDSLYDLQEMGLSGAATVKVVMSEAAPYFQLSASGNLGTLEVEFNRSAELFTIFDCRGSYEWEYDLEALLLGMRALMHADQTYVRMNDEGVMCIQHRVHCGQDPSYVDFLMVPTVPEEDMVGGGEPPEKAGGAGGGGGGKRRQRSGRTTAGSDNDNDDNDDDDREDNDDNDDDAADDDDDDGGGSDDDDDDDSSEDEGGGDRRSKTPGAAARAKKRRRREEARQHMREKLQLQQQQEKQQKQKQQQQQQQQRGGSKSGKRKKEPTHQNALLDDDEDDDFNL